MQREKEYKCLCYTDITNLYNIVRSLERQLQELRCDLEILNIHNKFDSVSASTITETPPAKSITPETPSSPRYKYFSPEDTKFIDGLQSQTNLGNLDLEK